MWQLTKRREGPSTSVDGSSPTREPHRLYYIRRLQETFRRDTAEMAPASFSHVFTIVLMKAIDQ